MDTPIIRRLETASGVSLAYAEFLPERSTGGDVVLVHGLASAGLQFHEDALHFARRGHRVIVPDLRGHGMSGVPEEPWRATDFSISVLAQDVIDMLDHAHADRVHWVGNSLGGILALHFLGTTMAERLESLAVFGTCFSMSLPGHIELAVKLAFPLGAKVTAALTARATTRSPFGRRAVEAAVMQFNPEAGAAIVANLRRYDFIANARRYDRPLLVLRGGRDHAVNMRLCRDIDRLADRPNVRRVDLIDGGHCANFDMPDAFRAALETHWQGAE